jgi:catechol 2,3-dioxygenase-like lactoylglutathione lyase family enzyme
LSKAASWSIPARNEEVEMAIQGIFYISAHVSNLARSKRFFAEKLGWKLETDEPTVAGFRFGSGYLVLLAEPANPAGKSSTAGMQVAVKVTDIDSEHARLLRAGVEVSELRTQPWGEKSFRFQDPDGYEWSFGEVGDA